jgi:molecular chaperone DnaK
MAAQNRTLGKFKLSGIPPAPRGVPQVEVTFDIDANGIVNVAARDKATGKEQQIRIQASGGLTEQDIQRMVREAEQHATEDRRRREVIEARNQADSLIYVVEKDLKDAGSQLAAPDRQRIEEAIGALRTAIASDELSVIQQRISSLTEAAQRIAEAKQQASQPRPDQEGAGNSASDDVVDAEFEEVNEKQRRAS